METASQDITPRTTATTAAEGRLKVGVSSRSIRMMKKKSQALKATVRNVKGDGAGGPGLFSNLGNTVRKITDTAVGDVKSVAKNVGDTVSGVGNWGKGKVQEIIRNQQQKNRDWLEKRNKFYRDKWRSKVPGKENVGITGSVVKYGNDIKSVNDMIDNIHK